MKLKSLPTTLLSVILAGSVIMGTSGCASDAPPQSAEPTTTTDASESPEDTEVAAEEDATNCETDADRGSSLDPDSVPAGLPDGFPGIGVPFYPDAIQMAAQGDTGELYVLEYLSEHELTIVNMFFADKLVENCWEILDKSVEGSTTVHKVWIPGYSLVVAVGPDKIDDSKTSIYYTLRLQQEP